LDDGGHRRRTGCVAHGCVPMAEGDAESREFPLCAPHAGYSDEEEAYTETKAEGNQLFSKECLYCEQEVRLMQGGMPTSTSEFTGRYIHIRKRGGFGGLLALDFVAWRKFGRSPIWLEFTSSEWGKAQEVTASLSRTDLYLIDLAECSERRGVGTPITLMPNTDKRKVIENCAVQIREVADILLAGSA